MSEVKEGCHVSQNVSTIIDSLKVHIADDRRAYVKKKVEDNRKKLRGITDHAFNSSLCTKKTSLDSMVSDADLLARRQEDALAMLSGLDISCGQKDNSLREEESSNSSSSFLFGNNIVGKNCTRPIKLPEVSKLPPYTTWIFLDRNQRMAEDQSVLGRRRIYYDQRCGEALICSDSEEDIADDEEEKKVFGKVEDYILRMTIQEAGLFDDVLEALAQCLGGNPSEIKERYELLISRENPENCSEKRESESCFKAGNINLDKDLDAALESFDNLFCRRCLVFDCRLHGCSQDLVYPVEKQLPFSYSGDGSVCGLHCYKLASKLESATMVNSQILRASGDLTPSSSSAGLNHSPKKKSKSRSNQSESASSNAKVGSESSDSESQPQHSSALNSKLTTKGGLRKKNKRSAENALMCMYKKQKKAAPSESDSMVIGFTETRESKLRSNTCSDNHDANSSSRNKNLKPIIGRKSRQNISKSIDVKNKLNDETSKETLAAKGDELARKEFVDENICQPENGRRLWMDLEKSLFAKGVEIFGKNSCFIARNLLSGMKTCMDVFQYMNSLDKRGASGANDGSDSPVDGNDKGKDRTRSRLLRRRGKVRRLKYTWKSTSCHSIRKRITEKKDQPCRQYNPCGCQTACGKQCPCLLNGTCCEKYCGCPKICKNQFRGCHCAKSQCRSRQCPCFAADRECDPDVCRNCWIGCGDGTFGGPNQRGDNYECRNMKLLLRQQQRVLLGRSDVSGWGAFVKNSVAKHEYLGEYTGELISHKEADKRGKIYDRENSSFLFNLNDQFVLDAYRKGDKLKFANHSPDPNCYAKVIMVAGDHRVGIFAKERISAGEELFYDYRYEADRAPAWARKPDAQGSKKVDTNYQTTGRAKKLA